MNDNCLDMDWTGNQGLSDSDLMNISNGCGFDITIGANNGEEIRRAYNTLPWKSDYEINNTYEQEEDIDKDKYVDLGLPTGLLWAKCNLGANLPEESGKYYQWGDTEGYYEDQIVEGVKIYNWETYKYFGGLDPKSGNTLLTKYCNNPEFGLDGYIDDLDILESSDDAATLELGNKWRMPTPEDFDELLELDQEVTTLNDIPGVKFIGYNGNELFIPFSGCVENDEIFDKDYSFNLWSNCLDTDYCINSWYLWYGDDGNYSVETYFRYEGHPIRPVNISKLKKKFEVNVEANNYFAGNILGGGMYYEGDHCTLQAIPNLGFLFINWTKGGKVVSEDSEYSFIVKEDAIYIANFGVDITTQSNPVEGGTTSGDGTYVIGNTCTLVATPSSDYVFQNWRKEGIGRPVIVSTNPTYTFEIIATRRENSGGTYIAYFLPLQYKITTSSSPVEGGTTNGGGTYNKNSTCTLTATPREGYVFENWTENGNVISSESTYSFTVSGDRDIVANFTPIPQYTITTQSNPVEGGTVSGGGTFYENSTCTLIATPNDIYVFNNWTENGNVISSESTYSFTVSGNRDIVANFTLQSYDIEVTVNDESRGTVNGAGTYTYGSNCTLVATPNSSDYVFKNWTENGNIISSESTYSFTVSGNRNIVANFGKIISTIIVSSSNGDNSLVYIDTPGVLQKDILNGQTCSVHAVEYNNGYVFNGWMDNNIIISYELIYTFVVTEDKTLVANYIEERYLTFTADQNNSSVGFVIKTVGSVSSTPQVSLQYSIDNCATWNTYTIGLGIGNAQLINLNSGDTVKFRGNNPNGLAIRESSSKYSYLNCITNGSVLASGDLNSIINNIGGDISLPNYCFYYLFGDCVSLTQAPELPATILSDYCYGNMFRGCISLTQAPELPSTALASSCYYSMFYGCTGLMQAPELPASTLASYCYSYMFYGCTGLMQAPELPASTLASYCYNYMFSSCTSLTSVSELPATILVDHCYYYMFDSCTSLTSAPELPATTLANYCYYFMFNDCTGLTQAPELPAITLKDYCYYYMFRGCTSLTQAPELPSKTLVTMGYTGMFYGCTGLTQAPQLSATNLANACYRGMFNGCTSLTQAPDLPAKNLNIECYRDMFRNCTSLTQAPELPATTLNDNCYDSMFNGCTSLTQAPEIHANIVANSCCESMFNGCTSLTQAPTLPATTLKDSCYELMFNGCTSLTQAPTLPATTLATECYREMFKGCTSLVEAPQLSAINLANGCYRGMFNGCTSLTQAPTLPATTLKESCYSYMFYSCTSLTQAPELPATTLASTCYIYMFDGCTSLTQAPELPATTLKDSCYISMFYGCTSLTSAPELPATTLMVSCYNGMFRNCTSLTQAPELPATNLANSCYNYMFYGCTLLNYIKCLATNVSATNCTANWVTGVSGSGTFIKDPNMDSWTTGNNGIPSGWTVQDNV